MAKIVYLVTEDWFFCSHWLNIATAAKAAGFEVVVVTRVSNHREQIVKLGFRLIPITWERKSINPFMAVMNIWQIHKILKAERLDILHNMSMKCIVLGNFAALFCNVRAIINSITGLGFLFNSDRLKVRLVRPFFKVLLKLIFMCQRNFLIIENRFDKNMLIASGIANAQRTYLIRGAGVDVDKLTPLPLPDDSNEIVVAYVGRMLKDKGVGELILAQQHLLSRGLSIRLLLAGLPDTENPTSFSLHEYASWAALPKVELLGYVSDVREVWKRAHIAVLPSYHEGLSKSLLEAMASARPIIATKVSGSMEIVNHNVNGLLVAPRNVAELEHAMEILSSDKNLRNQFAKVGRMMVEGDMSAKGISETTITLYNEVLNGR